MYQVTAGNAKAEMYYDRLIDRKRQEQQYKERFPTRDKETNNADSI
jgi:hypothetical protein